METWHTVPLQLLQNKFKILVTWNFQKCAVCCLCFSLHCILCLQNKKLHRRWRILCIQWPVYIFDRFSIEKVCLICHCVKSDWIYVWPQLKRWVICSSWKIICAICIRCYTYFITCAQHFTNLVRTTITLHIL